MKAKRTLRAEVDRVRLKAGLALYNGPLVYAKCEECGRAYNWRPELLPKTCGWPGCDGELRLIQTPEQ